MVVDRTEDYNSFYVSVRSQDCQKLQPGFTTAISVNIDPPQVVEYGFGFIIKVVKLYVPYSFYNVNSNNNRFNFQYVEGVTNLTFTVTVPPGNWALVNLLSYLQVEVRAQTANTTINFELNRSIGKTEVTVGASPVSTLTILMASGLNATNQSRQLLGITTDLSTSSGTTSTGDRVASVLTIPRIVLRSDLIGENSYDTATATSSNALAEITVDTPLFSILSFVAENTRAAYVIPSQISVANFSLTDPDYNLIDLNGLDWSFTFLVSQVKLLKSDPEQVNESRRRYLAAQLSNINLDELPPIKRPRIDLEPAVSDAQVEESRDQQVQKQLAAPAQEPEELKELKRKRDDIRQQSAEKQTEKKEKEDERIDEVLNAITQ